MGQSVKECKDNVRETVALSTKLGFVIHPEKCQLEPKTEINYLGFTLNSKSMTVKLTCPKVLKLKQEIEKTLRKDKITIQQLAKIVGTLVASLPGVQYGKVFYRQCDNYKTKALKENKGNFNAKITLPNSCKEDLSWWDSNIENTVNKINKGNLNFELESDASNTGWGGCCRWGKQEQVTGGNWSKEERGKHINYLELLAAWLTIQNFCKNLKNEHIKILCDNTTAVAYLNNMGGTKFNCNSVARQIWLWCYKNNNWVTAAHLPGKDNVTADKQSRSMHDNMEWKLNPMLFSKICDHWGKPDIDLFASRLNNQTQKYCSWKPDPGAAAVDALSIDWGSLSFYAFPPFNMVGRVLRKIEEDEAEGIIVVPHWPTQPWFPKLLKLCGNDVFILYRKNMCPTLSHPWREETTLPTTKILAGSASGKRSKKERTSTSQQGSCSWRHGNKGLTNNIKCI